MLDGGQLGLSSTERCGHLVDQNFEVLLALTPFRAE
jgi:hypothetical protein